MKKIFLGRRTQTGYLYTGLLSIIVNLFLTSSTLTPPALIRRLCLCPNTVGIVKFTGRTLIGNNFVESPNILNTTARLFGALTRN